MDLAKESVNYCRNTRITAYLRRFRPISGGSQLTQSWSKKANFRFLGDHWSVLLQSTGALNSSQADLQLKRADNSASWWPKKKERDCAIQTAWLSACSLFFLSFFFISSILANLSSINTRKFWPKKPNICQLQKNIVHRYPKKKSFDRACWTPIHFPSILLLEKKFNAQHLSCGYFDFWPKMYGTNLVFSEKILKNIAKLFFSPSFFL